MAIVVLLTELLGRYVRMMDLGRLFVDSILLRLPERPSGHMPDLFVIAKVDLDRVRHQWVDGPARLAVEIVSDESVGRDTREKRAEYGCAGISEYHIVEGRPGHQGTTLLRLGSDGRYQPVAPDADGRLRSAALLGFWLDPAWLEHDASPSIERLMLQIAPESYRAFLSHILAGGTDEPTSRAGLGPAGSPDRRILRRRPIALAPVVG